MKTVKVTDREGIHKGYQTTVNIPDNTVLVGASFGAFGWRATLAKPGVRIHCHKRQTTPHYKLWPRTLGELAEMGTKQEG